MVIMRKSLTVFASKSAIKEISLSDVLLTHSTDSMRGNVCEVCFNTTLHIIDKELELVDRK